MELSIDMPTSELRSRRALRDITSYVATAIKKKGRSEVHESKMSMEDKKLFAGAKALEIRGWLAEKVLSALPAGKQVPPDKVMRMRWVLTWKTVDVSEDHPSGKKAKARLVVLGFEDPELGEVETSSPTMTRLTRQLYLQVCAHRRFKVEKADASVAFLQGRKTER